MGKIIKLEPENANYRDSLDAILQDVERYSEDVDMEDGYE